MDSVRMVTRRVLDEVAAWANAGFDDVVRRVVGVTLSEMRRKELGVNTDAPTVPVPDEAISRAEEHGSLQARSAAYEILGQNAIEELVRKRLATGGRSAALAVLDTVTVWAGTDKIQYVASLEESQRSKCKECNNVRGPRGRLHMPGQVCSACLSRLVRAELTVPLPGQQIHAIKKHRELAGGLLADSKAYVDELSRKPDLELRTLAKKLLQRGRELSNDAQCEELLVDVRKLTVRQLTFAVQELAELSSISRAREIVPMDETRQDILVHSACTFATGKAWSPIFNDMCWPEEWVRPAAIRSFILGRTVRVRSFHPQALKYAFSSTKRTPEFRAFSWRDEVTNLQRQEKIVPVIPKKRGGELGLYCHPRHQNELARQLSQRLASRGTFRQMSGSSQARAQLAARHPMGTIINFDDDIPRVAAALSGHEPEAWWALKAPRVRVDHVADAILDGMVRGKLKLESIPEKWTPTVKAWYFDRISSALTERK